MTPLPTRFTIEDAHRANDEWGANCGPGALAAILGLTLDQVRPHIPGFEAKRYTNTKMMVAALKSLGARFTTQVHSPSTWLWPRYGLARVQWDGPWMKPNVPERARAGKTHWIGACMRGRNDVGIFDINCINNGSGWVSFADWNGILVPVLTKAIKRASGDWHVTNAIEVERPA